MTRPGDDTVTAPAGSLLEPAEQTRHPTLIVVYHRDPALIGSRLVAEAAKPIVLGRGGGELPLGVLDDSQLSRRHLELRVEKGGWVGRDLGSRNGTRLNGEPWPGGLLSAGDVLGIGQLLLLVSYAPRVAPSGASDALVFASHAMAELVRRARTIAAHDTTVLIQGPTGVGKDLLAQEIHRVSGRKGAWVAVNCASLGDGVLQSELFGHRRGAFSGADQDRRGFVESAGGGTLFLDEIGDASPLVQAAMLRLLEQGEYRRLGEDTVRRSSARVLAATHVPLADAVQQGRFRADLAARLSRFTLEIPPLRERPEDIVPIALAGARLVARGEATLSPELTLALLGYPWPANAREVGSIVAEAWVEGGCRSPIELVPAVAARLDAAARATRELEVASPTPQTRERRVRPPREELIALIEAERGNLRSLARRLEVSRATVYRWVAELGIDLDQVRKAES